MVSMFEQQYRWDEAPQADGPGDHKNPQKPLVQQFRRACVAEAVSMRDVLQRGSSE